MSKVPPRLTYSGIDAPLYVPMDGEGNATVPHNLTTETVEVTGTSVFDGLVTAMGDLNVEGAANITGVINGGSVNTAGNITVEAPGIFVGDGRGLTNLPQSTIGLQPAFFVQSQLINFSTGVNYFVPADEINIPVTLSIPCELYGRTPGLYFWKTDANILVQNLWNSASGFVYWDGTKVSGETSWSLVQYTSIENPLYFLSYSLLSIDSLTRFNVVMTSTYPTLPIDPAQFSNYYVNFFLIAGLGGSAPALPIPTGVAVTNIEPTTATVGWTQVPTYNYTVYLQGPGPPVILTAGMSAQFNLTGLIAGTSYTVQVQASTFSGSQSQVSERSVAVPFTTSTP